MTPVSRWWAAAPLDAAAVVAFVVIGRASHERAGGSRGILSTLWPFAVGTIAGRAIVARRSPASVPGGAVVCACTVASGMVLRAATGQRTAPSFVGVTTGFLGTVMVGGRFVAAHLTGRHRRVAGAAPSA